MTEKTKKTIKRYISGGIFGMAAFVLPALFFWLLESYTHNPFLEVRPRAQLFNILLFELAAGILFCLTGRYKAACRIEACAAMLFGIANAYVVRFRTNPLVPWDLFSVRTAANVAGNYDFTPDARMIAVTLAFLILMAALIPVRIRPWRLVFWKRWLLGGVLTLCLVCFADTLQQESFQNRHFLYNKLFTPVYMTNVDGIAVTFVMNLAYMSIERPEGYSAAEAKELLAEYEQTALTAETEEEELPNLIVVMNESFADLSALGSLQTSRDYLPFLHRLQNGAPDTVTGTLHVSVCGGNTANTEFEFLTGNTMAFLPQGSIPYQQYLTGECPSLASHLKSLGYQTVATHPYYANGWERDTVYPWLGFSESLFLDAYDMAPRVRNYVSDMGCVDKIIELYENKAEGRPIFIFNVTMQNHGGYQDLYPNFTPEITAEGIENISLEQYLSLAELSDRSLEALIEYFSQAPERTVVVFFGDHQPGDTVAAPVLAQNGMRWNALTEDELPLRYEVPYVIWANYDIEEAKNADTSANYLGAQVCARAGIPADGYRQYLLDQSSVVPVLSAVRTETAAQTGEEEENESLLRYRKLQYYMIFDQKGEP